MMEELKFLSAAVLALIIAVSCQEEYNPAAGYSQMYGGDILYQQYVDVISIYTFKGVRV